MKTCHLWHRVPFSDTDSMGIVHHSNHAKYLERGRVEFLRLIKLPYNELVASGFHFPLTSLDVTFKKPIHFDEIIRIETILSFKSKTRISFAYKIFSDQNEATASMAEPSDSNYKVSANTEHCCVDLKGRPVKIPENIFGIFCHWSSE